MEESLNLENILSTEEIDNLFSDTNEDTQEPGSDNPGENNSEKQITEVDSNNLFDDPESVGNGDNEDVEDANSFKDSNTSPNKNFYSSNAKALKEEGIFPDLSDEDISNIKSPEDFVEAIENQIKAKFDERYKRIEDALNVGLEPTEIKKYEATINYLDSIEESKLTEDSNTGEDLRKKLIFQDFLNRGYSKERAEREVTKSFNSGSDLEDAKEALKSNIEYFKSEYNSLIEEGKKEEQKIIAERKSKAEKLKKSILEDDKVFGDLIVDKNTRQKIYNNISRPTYKNPETGEYMTALQKYERENKTDFMKYVGLIYTMTDGFKDLGGLIKNKVKKEITQGMRNLEQTINNTSRTTDGNIKFVSGVDKDPESYIKWDLDI